MSEKKPDPAPAAPEPGAAAPAKGGGGGGAKAMLPAILAIVLAPAATFGVAQFVILPRFEAGLKTALSPEGAEGAEGAAAAHAEGAADDGHGGKAAPADPSAPIGEANSYRFENIVVNLAGTMGTRYLKTSFQVAGEKPDVVARFEAAKPQLGDITLAVLSSLTLADLEEPGSRNIIRERLIAAYNRALGARVVDRLFFSEFVVQ